MKNLLLILVTLCSVSVFANENLPVVTDINSSTFIDTRGCELCQGGPEVTTTTFTFVNQWCSTPSAEDAYEIVISERQIGLVGDTEKTVAVAQKGFMVDCMGPTSERTFELSTQELKRAEGYILLNPTVLKK